MAVVATHLLRWLAVGIAVALMYFNLHRLVNDASAGIFPSLGGNSVKTVERVADDEPPLPDWRIVTDCSTYNTDCATHAQTMGRYREYPFQFHDEELYEQYTWENLQELPRAWRESIEQHTPPNGTIDLHDYYEYPPQVSSSKANKCTSDAETRSFDDQLDLVLQQLDRAGDKDKDLDNMVSFTISDFNYAFDMIHEVFEMAWDLVGFPNAFFMVALDRATVELACRYGYPVVAGPGALGGPDENNLKSKVANTKFVVSHKLVERHESFFFFEMDVFFVKTPKPWLLLHHSKEAVDMMIASHQNNPRGPNIGVYSVLANDATREFFRILLEWTALSPSSHDQWLMSMVWWTSEWMRKGQPVKFDQKEWDPAPELPTFQHHVKVHLWGPHEVVSSEWIVPTQATIAIHPLCGAPLRSPHGKKIIAKELGAWYGFSGPNGSSGYYRRRAEHRRYLLLDGRVLGGYSTVMNGQGDWGFYHDEVSLRLTVAVLVALARRSKRILVLPKLVRDRGTYFLWTDLDLQSLEGLVEVRETNFPSNPKSWYSTTVPFQTVARTAVGGDGRLFAELPMDGGVRTWKLNNTRDSLAAFFASATAISEIDKAEVLLANPYIVQGAYKNDLHRRAEIKELTKLEKEIMQIYTTLRWCNKKGPIQENVASISRSEFDCYGRGEKVFTTRRK